MSSVRQSIIEDRVESIRALFDVTDSKAFELFSFSLVTGESERSLKSDSVVDGGQDKQIDLIYIDETEDEATVYIIQSKYTSSFSSNTIIQMKNGLEWIFSKQKKEVLNLANQNFKDKILEVRSLRSDMGPSNLTIKTFYITNAESADTLSAEGQQEYDSIIATYSNNTFKSFELKLIGASEAVDILNFFERKDKTINEEIKFRYDVNNPSLIRYYEDDVSAMVCSVSGSEIARIVNNDKEGVIFDLNIRKFLGRRGSVNQEIEKSCTDESSSGLFWFLNNGITIVCDKFDPVNDADNPKVKVENMQIVNGCQTANTLANMQTAGTLKADVKLLLRIYQSNERPFVESIVRATNNQNRISDRDLRSNDKRQMDLEAAFRAFNLYFERKRWQYAKDTTIQKDRIIENEGVGRAFMAIQLKRPSDARSRIGKIWSDQYEKVFGNSSIKQYVYSILLYRKVDEWLANSRYMTSTVDLERAVAKNCTAHIARMASFYFRKNDDWSGVDKEIDAHISQLNTPGFDVSKMADQACQNLIKIIGANPTFSSDPIRAFKAKQLDTEITKSLNAKKP